MTFLRKVIVPVVLGVLATLGMNQAHATLLAYDGFNYTPGVLSGNSGGGDLGWVAAWQQNGGNINNSLVLSGSYSYSDLAGNMLVTSGNRAYFTGDGSATGDNISGGTSASTQPLRRLSFIRGNTGATESTWVSFLALRTDNASPAPAAAPADYQHGRAAGVQFFFNATTTSTAAGSEQFTVGRATQSSETDTSLPNDTWSVLSSGGANNTKASTVNFATVPADFILMRIDHIGTTATSVGNADTLRIWINPSSLTGAPTDASADVVYTSSDFGTANTRDWVFDRIRLFGGNGQGTVGTTYTYGAMNVDEIRIGDGFVDVTPYTAVPEPAACALLGVGMLALINRFRRIRG
ncbi:MAG: hypothetical protein EPO07_07035 [Verrucomicrobia bacterium]|nr:MAG: hypothetical protein EPO07_07035 [Verrucomicrobiota bacterium]